MWSSACSRRDKVPRALASDADFIPALSASSVVGIGGLGHLALQFARAMGCEVTAISSSPDKEEEARAVLTFLQSKVLAAARPEGQLGGLGHDVTLRGALEAARAAGRAVYFDGWTASPGPLVLLLCIPGLIIGTARVRELGGVFGVAVLAAVSFSWERTGRIRSDRLPQSPAE